MIKRKDMRYLDTMRYPMDPVVKAILIGGHLNEVVQKMRTMKTPVKESQYNRWNGYEDEIIPEIISRIGTPNERPNDRLDILVYDDLKASCRRNNVPLNTIKGFRFGMNENNEPTTMIDLYQYGDEKQYVEGIMSIMGNN
jgi:hypothetical protein